MADDVTMSIEAPIPSSLLKTNPKNPKGTLNGKATSEGEEIVTKERPTLPNSLQRIARESEKFLRQAYRNGEALANLKGTFDLPFPVFKNNDNQIGPNPFTPIIDTLANGINPKTEKPYWEDKFYSKEHKRGHLNFGSSPKAFIDLTDENRPQISIVLGPNLDETLLTLEAVINALDPITGTAIDELKKKMYKTDVTHPALYTNQLAFLEGIDLTQKLPQNP